MSMLGFRDNGRTILLCVETVFAPGREGVSIDGRSRISSMESCLDRSDGGTKDRLPDGRMLDCSSECSESLLLLFAAITAALVVASCARLTASCLALNGSLIDRIHDSLSMVAAAVSEEILLLELTMLSSISLSLCSLLSVSPRHVTLGSGWPCIVCADHVRCGCP